VWRLRSCARAAILTPRAPPPTLQVRAFFVKYNDPAYVKAEKLDVLVALATEASVDAVLAELKGSGGKEEGGGGEGGGAWVPRRPARTCRSPSTPSPPRRRACFGCGERERKKENQPHPFSSLSPPPHPPEYASEVDVDFARKAVRCVGALAVSVDAAAERCVSALLDLVRARAPHVVQEAVPVVRDILRRYPGRYEGVLGDLCDCLDALDEPAVRGSPPGGVGGVGWGVAPSPNPTPTPPPKARGAMAWIVGEYADRIDNAADLLESFLDAFPEEPAAVQLALVTAAVKLFLKRPDGKAQTLLQLVLTHATQEADNPDLRDRAFVYWRLLSSDPEAARDVVLAEKPVIERAGAAVDADLAASLLPHLATLASVYHKPPSSFVSRARPPVARADDLEAARAAGGGDAGAVGPSSAAVPAGLAGDLLDMGEASAGAPAAAPAATDLLGGLAELAVGVPAARAAAPAAAFDPFGDPFAAPAPAAPPPALRRVLDPAGAGRGLAADAAVVRGPGGAAGVYRLRLANTTAAPLDGFMLQFNRNAAGLAPAAQAVPVGALPPGGGAVEVDVPLALAPTLVDAAAGARLQVALRCTQLGVFYYDDALP